eukprot:31339-Pelagococcus_subviridis.AAC.2
MGLGGNGAKRRKTRSEAKSAFIIFFPRLGARTKPGVGSAPPSLPPTARGVVFVTPRDVAADGDAFYFN